MKIKSFTNKIKFAAASLLVVVSLFTVAATPVFAKSAGPLDQLSKYNRLSSDQMSSLFQHDQTWSIQLDRSINGQDHSSDMYFTNANVQSAADGSRMSNLYRAQLDGNIVQSLINSHPGFDSNGVVTNRTAAASTLVNIEYTLRNAQYWLNRSNVDFTSRYQLTK